MALTANTPLKVESGMAGHYNDIPAAAAHLYEGQAIGLDSSGYARALVAGDLILGHLAAECDNSAGSAGDLNAHVRQGVYRIVYAVTEVELTVCVVKVGHRSSV